MAVIDRVDAAVQAGKIDLMRAIRATMAAIGCVADAVLARRAAAKDMS
jgi:hypothetical protein